MQYFTRSMFAEASNEIVVFVFYVPAWLFIMPFRRSREREKYIWFLFFSIHINVWREKCPNLLLKSVTIRKTSFSLSPRDIFLNCWPWVDKWLTRSDIGRFLSLTWRMSSLLTNMIGCKGKVTSPDLYTVQCIFNARIQAQHIISGISGMSALVAGSSCCSWQAVNSKMFNFVSLISQLFVSISLVTGDCSLLALIFTS